VCGEEAGGSAATGCRARSSREASTAVISGLADFAGTS